MLFESEEHKQRWLEAGEKTVVQQFTSEPTMSCTVGQNCIAKEVGAKEPSSAPIAAVVGVLVVAGIGFGVFYYCKYVKKGKSAKPVSQANKVPVQVS